MNENERIFNRLIIGLVTEGEISTQIETSLEYTEEDLNKQIKQNRKDIKKIYKILKR